MPMEAQLTSNKRNKEKDEGLSLNARKAMIGLKWLAWVFAAGIIVQVFLAGLALFVDSANWAAHSGFPRYFAFLPIIMFLLSVIMRLPVTYLAQSIRLIIMVAATFATAILSTKIGYLSALHPVIAVALFMSAMSLARNAAAHTRSTL